MAGEIHNEMKKAFCDETFSIQHVRRWIRLLKKTSRSTFYEPRSGQKKKKRWMWMRLVK
ncbi:hypothetical protein PGB90_003271 [Kerria lacca]